MHKLFFLFTVLLCFLASFAPAANAAQLPASALKEATTAAKVTKKAKAKPHKAPPQRYKLDYIGETQKYTAEYEDTLIHLARKNNLGFIEIRSANPHLDPWIPGEGAEIILPKRHILPNAPRKGVVINLGEMRLYYYPAHAATPVSFPIGIGRDGLQTPIGSTKIIRKAIGPRWRPTARMREEDPSLPAVVEAGPDNPLGTHALYLGWPEYAIHGTNRPYGIGRRVSSGCIRMYPEGIIKAYEMIKTGTDVSVVDQAIKAGWIDDKLYIEAHAGQEFASDMERKGQIPEQELTSDQIAYIRLKAGERANEIDWDVVKKIYKARSGYPVPILTTKISAAAKEAIADVQDIAQEKDNKASVKKAALQETDKEKSARQSTLKASYND